MDGIWLDGERLREVGRLDRDGAPPNVRRRMEADGKRTILSVQDGQGRNFTATVYDDGMYTVRPLPL